MAEGRLGGTRLALVSQASAPTGTGWLRGYGRTIAGTELSYHSPYPDVSSALISRASDGSMAMEWETEPVPLDWKGDRATFVWLAGHATCKGGHRFDLALDGRRVLSFHTSPDASRREWRQTGAEGVALSFRTVMIDQFDELFGFMWLEVPASLLRTGRPAMIRVTGEAAGSNDWVMVFRDNLRRDVWARGEQALVRGDGGRLFQIVRVEVSHLGPPAGALVSCANAASRLELSLGYNALEFLIPAVEREERLTIEVRFDDGSLRRGELTAGPVTPREIWLLPHSHVDIGYSDPQPVVERKHWRYYREAITLAAESAGYPEGARFKWNTEQAWALETYLRQASAAEKAALIEAVRRSAIGLQATLAGVLTGLCHPEELFHLTRFARGLGRLAGRPVDSVMVTDIPSQSWSLVPALALAGIKYVSSGPNYMPSLFDGGDRVGWALRTWGDRPFYWLSPSGGERVLFWMAGRGYSWFHGLNMGSLAKAPAYRIFEYMGELEAKCYPYEMVQARYTVGGDNGPPDPELADRVRAWNDKYSSPKLVIATASEMFAEFERRHGRSLPEVRGDFTGYWEDGAASTARETAEARGAAGRLVQAEALWSILGRDGFPADLDEEAWRQIILFSEHTWGASESVSDPDGEGTRAQWAYKKAFASRSDRLSRDLLEMAAGRRAPTKAGADGGAIDVVNTCSWDRTDLVMVPGKTSAIGDRVVDAAGEAVPSQRLRDGRLAFLAEAVPGLGAKRYVIREGHGPAEGTARVEPGGLESVELRAAVDPATGAITSLVWKAGPGRELVENGEQPGLAHYLYVPGLDPRKARTVSNVRVEPAEPGPLVASIVVVSEAPGATGLRREYRIVDGLPRLAVEVTIDKTKVRDKESVHIAFPFAVPDGVVRVDAGWGFVRPEADQIPGACRDYFCARDCVDISGRDFGLTWTSLDAPLVEIGALTDESPKRGERRDWLRLAPPSMRLYSYAMNNYWHTNYKADQEGRATLRYVVAVHRGSDTAAAKRLGLEASAPLVPVPADPASPAPRFPLAVANKAIVATRLRPLADGTGWLLRLFNASSATQRLALSGEAWEKGRVYASDIDGSPGPLLQAPLDVPAFGILTLVVRNSAPLN
jgi:alpha-mannosidase